MSILTTSEVRTADAEKKIGWWWVVMGHSMSLEIVPFGILHTTPNSLLRIVTLCHCHVCRFWDAARYWWKSPIFFDTTCVWRRCWEWVHWNLIMIFGFRKLESLGYRGANIAWWSVQSFQHNTKTKTKHWI